MVGIPTAVFVRLEDSSNELVQIINDNEVIFDSKTIFFDKIFGSETNNSRIFETLLLGQNSDGVYQGKGLSVLRGFVENNIPGCILLMGTDIQRKNDLFHGQHDTVNDDGGIIVATSILMFHLLRTKQKMISSNFSEIEIEISFAESYDEVITDLLFPMNNDLEVTFDTVNGYTIEGLGKIKANSEDDVKKAVMLGRSNRNRQVYLNGGSASSSSSAVFRFEYHQREGETRETSVYRHTDLILMECPSLHKLVSSPDHSPAQLITEQQSLSQALHAFVRGLETLSSVNSTPSAAPLTQSKLMRLLWEPLGGHAVVAALVSVGSPPPAKVLNESAKNAFYKKGECRVALQMADRLMSVCAHPVMEVPGPVALLPGLLTMYRRCILNLLNVQESHSLGGQDTASVKAHLDCARAKEDCAKVYKMLESFKEKYSELVNEKGVLSNELEEAEQERLEVTKALLELKLQVSQEREQMEAEKYQAASDLLAAQDGILDLHFKVQEAEKKVLERDLEIRELGEKLEEAMEQREKDQLQLKNQLEQLENERNQNTELSAELLTLINQNQALLVNNKQHEAEIKKIQGCGETCKQESPNQETTRFQPEMDHPSPARAVGKSRRSRQSSIHNSVKEDPFAQTAQLQPDSLLQRVKSPKSECLPHFSPEIQQEPEQLFTAQTELALLRKQVETLQSRKLFVLPDAKNERVPPDQKESELVVSTNLEAVALQELFSNCQQQEENLVEEATFWRGKYYTLLEKTSVQTSTAEQNTISELKTEILSLRQNLHSARSQVKENQEKLLRVINKFKDKTQNVKQIKLTNSLAVEQLAQEKDKETASARVLKAGIEISKDDDLISMQQRIQEMQRLLLQKLAEVKDQVISGSEKKLSGAVNVDQSALKSSNYLKQKTENQHLLSRISKLENNIQCLITEKASFLDRIHEMELLVVEKSSRDSVDNIERRCAELLSKNVMFEEELRNYHEYMRKTIHKFQHQISMLTKENVMLKSQK